jgi:TonB family protein
MDERKPTDDKRRAIEGILGPGKRRPDVELPDEYRPTGIGSTAAFPKKGGDGALNNALLVAAVILLIGIFAAFLILAKDSIFGVFGIGNDKTAQQSVLVAGGRQGDEVVDRGDYERLAGYNKELEQTLEQERATSAKLRDDIGKLTSEVERLHAAESEAAPTEDQLQKMAGLEAGLKASQEQVEQLQKGNETLKTQMKRQNTADELRIGRLEQDNKQLQDKIDELQRDLAAGRSELNVLRSSADKSQSASEQLDQVNAEYRRLLERMREAQAAGRKKDEQIEELLQENGVLRNRLASAEEKVEAAESTDTRLATAEPGQSSSEGIRNPVPIHMVRPEYPDSAIRRRVAGTVKVRVLVSESGQVLEAEIISSPDPMGALDRAALSAVRAWKFDPARRDGRPVQMYYVVPLVFKL